MPLPLYHNRFQHQENPSSRRSTRFSSVQSNVRSLLRRDPTGNGSIIPVADPNPPKRPFSRILRRSRRSSVAGQRTPFDFDLPRESITRSATFPPYAPNPQPLHHTENPRTSRAWNERRNDALPALPTEPGNGSSPTRYGSVDPETQQLAIMIRERARRKQRRSWKRKPQDRGKCFASLNGRQARTKFIILAVSGVLLGALLATYLAIALSRRHVGQEVHILFILIILCTTVIFCHSLVRLCMLALRPRPQVSRPRFPDMYSSEGFTPVAPIRVHMARDEEIAADGSDDHSEKDPAIAQPPPAYGLWRSSVRVDPNLIHWQPNPRYSTTPQTPNANTNPNQPNPYSFASRAASMHGDSTLRETAEAVGEVQARPPSYCSDDGVDYILSAAPRLTTPAPPPPLRLSNLRLSDVHPAFRLPPSPNPNSP